MTYACPLCGNEMHEHGTAGLACTHGHHFLAADIRGQATTVHRTWGREVRVPGWVPGAVLGGLALLVELIEAVI